MFGALDCLSHVLCYISWELTPLDDALLVLLWKDGPPKRFKSPSFVNVILITMQC